ncbi:MAG: hypothetical protein GWO21_13565, partial [Gammaproteobacteria bacterium]|nr:hypothetical protein [Gammaproteobacteria bacterium]
MGGKRDEYVENVKSQLDEWNARLERLEEDARLVRDEGRREYEQRIAQLRAKTEEYKKRLTEVQSASE